MISLIFDTIEPYVYEALPIMFLPDGFEYEARFKEKHVERSIVDEIRANSSVKVLSGERLLISLRTKHQPPAGSSSKKGQPSTALVGRNPEGQKMISPMRFASIVSVKLVSGFVLIRYRLEEFFEFQNPRDYAAIEEQRNRLNRDLYKFVSSRDEFGDLPHFSRCGHIAPPTSSNSRAPFFDSDWGLIDRNQLDAWGGVVSQFCFLPHINNLPFVMFATIREMVAGADPFPIRWAKVGYSKVRQFWHSYEKMGVPHTGDGRLKLRSNRSYELKIFECYPHELFDKNSSDEIPTTTAPPEKDHSREYRLNLDDNFFLTVSDQSAIGGYDFLEFPIATRPATNGSRGVLGLSLPELSCDADRRFISKRLVVEYEVRKGWLSVSFTVGLIALILSATGTGLNTPDQLASGLANLPWVSKAFADVVVALLQTTILAIGIGGVVSYLVTRKQ